MIATILLLAAFIAFVVAAILARAGFGWLVPAGLACWVLTQLLPRVL